MALAAGTRLGPYEIVAPSGPFRGLHGDTGRVSRVEGVCAPE